MNIGVKIKELRKQRGMTQEQLADRMCVSFQAVSKWENNVAMPDISILPMLARFFGVSMDVLFDFSLEEIEDKALEIAKESWKYRDDNDDKAREILIEGLSQYPDNDILLANLLYVTDCNERADEVLRIASKVVDITKDEAIKYDAFRFMAYAYKAKNDLDSAREILDRIPEIYFSRLSEKACVLTGEEKWNAACMEEGQALYILMLMKDKIAECYIEKGDLDSATKEYKRALGVLDALEAGADWDEWREQFGKKIKEIEDKMK